MTTREQEGEFMKIGNFFKAVIKTLIAAIAIGSIVYIIKDILDKKASDNFDDSWDDDFDEDFEDMFDESDSESEDSSVNREYVKIDPTKMSGETCCED